MSPADFVEQIKRPYWSPYHPSQYISKFVSRDGRRLILNGWGLLFPEDIGGFNLAWLVSGVGGPPADYGPYRTQTLWVAARSHWMVGDYQLRELAWQPLDRFAATLKACPDANRFELVLDALALRL